MGKWIKAENRAKCQKFRCSDCGRIVFSRNDNGKGQTYCDYLYCPYCRERKELNEYGKEQYDKSV